MKTIERPGRARTADERAGYKGRPQAYFGIRVVGRTAARTLGYVSVTEEIDVTTEEAMARSIARDMQGVDAVWIEHGPVAGKRLTLARRRCEVRRVDGEDED